MSTMKAIDNYGYFYSLLSKMEGDKEDIKRMLVHQYTKGRTSSLREMRSVEYSAMCNDLRSSLMGADAACSDVAKRKARSSALKLLQSLGVDTTDWDVIDRYCCDARIAGKVFKRLSTEELRLLAKKLRAIKKKESERKSNDARKVFDERTNSLRKSALLRVSGRMSDALKV